MDWYKTHQILEPRALNYSHLELSQISTINKLILVFGFNLKGGFFRVRHPVNCNDSIDLVLIPFPLHPIHVLFRDKCWTNKFDALTPIMLALLTCLVCMIFFFKFFLSCVLFFLMFPILIILTSLKLRLHVDSTIWLWPGLSIFF